MNLGYDCYPGGYRMNLVLIVTRKVVEGDLGEVFVGLTFPRAPVTLLIIIGTLKVPLQRSAS